jgi:putative transposase
MTNIRRYYLPNSIVFITSVTKDRIKIFNSKENMDLYWDVMRKLMLLHLFEMMAYTIMPDHFHWLIKLPQENPNFSKILLSFKGNFTYQYKKIHNSSTPLTLWQRRFWDHVIRDEKDFCVHLDYIHWNPVRHGFVKEPEHWIHSSFKSWVENGYYETGWSGEEPKTIRELNFE